MEPQLRTTGDEVVTTTGGFLEACIMLALEERPAYGYDLKRQLDDMGLSILDRGRIYRSLRSMEADGLVRSVWDTAGRGPARRIYDLEPLGVRQLEAQVLAVRGQRRQLTRFLARYERVRAARSEAVA